MQKHSNGMIVAFYHKVPFILQIIIGLLVGVGLAYAIPEKAHYITILGDLFVSALKAVAPLLVFVLVSSAIARHQKGMNAKLLPILILYFVAMCLSGAVALFVSESFPATFPSLANAATNSAPQSVASVLTNCIKKAVDNLTIATSV
ncbi:MAG: cation:dicarboxylase symporter family transporter, partial [Succinivibrionaceae bacterium]|nr:cation:dicarboxylase symporter family transporter [Succinivibrionaceae bacterium]